MKLYCVTNNHSSFKRHLFSCIPEFMEANKNLPRSSLVVKFLLRRAFNCNKNFILERSETLIIWSAFCYTSDSDKPWWNKMVPDQRLRGAAWVLTFWCPLSASIVNCEEIVYIVRHAFCCSMSCLNLMNRIFKYGDILNTSLTHDKELLNILIYWSSSYVLTTVINFWTWSRSFVPSCTVWRSAARLA